MHYLYRITNKVNGKSYIGITRNLISRWRVHAQGYGNATSAIQSAIAKYGVQHFIFETLETDESLEDVQKLEKQYIISHNTLAPNGYNITEGGDSTPDSRGEENGRALLVEQDILDIRRKYADRAETQVSLSKMYNVSRAAIGSIVRGETWKEVGGEITLGRRKNR